MTMNARRLKPTVTLLLLTILLVTGAGAAPKKIACVGDSITAGMGLDRRRRSRVSYPAQLGKLLGEGYEVKNFGVSGTTLLKKGDKPYWNTGAFKYAREFEPNIVVVKLGTNDSKARNWSSKAEFVADYVELVETFKSLAGNPAVYICRPIPVFVEPVKGRIDANVVRNEIPALIETVAEKTGAKVIDLYKVFDGKRELMTDPYHPNEAGAKVIAETVASEIAQN